MAEAEVIKDSPDSPEPPNKKPLVEMDETPHMEKAKGKDGSGARAVFSKALFCAVLHHTVCEKERLVSRYQTGDSLHSLETKDIFQH